MMKKRYTEKNDESTSEQTATVGAKRAREDETQEHRKK
jgi:hypothetical protein